MVGSKTDVLEEKKKQPEGERELQMQAGKAGRGLDHALNAMRSQSKQRLINSGLYFFLKVQCGCSKENRGQIKTGSRKATENLFCVQVLHKAGWSDS